MDEGGQSSVGVEYAGFKTIDGPGVGDFLLECTPVGSVDETFRGEQEGLEDLDRDTCEPQSNIHPRDTVLVTHEGREMSVEHLQLEPRIYPLWAKGSKDCSRSISVREVMVMAMKILVYYLSASSYQQFDKDHQQEGDVPLRYSE